MGQCCAICKFLLPVQNVVRSGSCCGKNGAKYDQNFRPGVNKLPFPHFTATWQKIEAFKMPCDLHTVTLPVLPFMWLSLEEYCFANSWFVLLHGDNCAKFTDTMNVTGDFVLLTKYFS